MADFEPFLDANRFDDYEVFTMTSTQQKAVEDTVAAAADKHLNCDLLKRGGVLLRDQHVAYLLTSLKHLPTGFQVAHLATTYAAVMCLCEIGTEAALKSIDRPKLLQFLLRMKKEDGSFSMHDSGESDVRGVYCALAAASLTNIMCEKLLYKADAWVISCQTYEGGFAGLPQNPPGPEAHGGYTHCALAALSIMGRANLVADADALLRWLVGRQMQFEGGFQGRTNKLVDSCYSFWVAGCFPLLEGVFQNDKEKRESVRTLFDTAALQSYLLNCCQDRRGGFHDKPGKPRDIYHTCYSLSGLSTAQNLSDDFPETNQVYGSPHTNTLKRTHAAFNVTLGNVKFAHKFFSTSGVVI